MEMPNTVPQSLNQNLLQDKYDRAAEVSPANYSFYMGASNGNLDQVLLTDPRTVCGVKVFMGSSTGDMLVDDAFAVDGIDHEDHRIQSTFQIRIFKDDDGIFAAQFEMRPLQRICALFGNHRTGAALPNKCDGLDVRVFCERLARK